MSIKELEKKLRIFIGSNNICCDCVNIRPIWVNVDIGSLICERCASFHEYEMGSSIKHIPVKGNSWKEKDVRNLVENGGNQKVNLILEKNLDISLKPNQKTTDDDRMDFLENKYTKYEYMDKNNMFHNAEGCLLVSVKKTRKESPSLKLLSRSSDKNYPGQRIISGRRRLKSIKDREKWEILYKVFFFDMNSDFLYIQAVDFNDTVTDVKILKINQIELNKNQTINFQNGEKYVLFFHPIINFLDKNKLKLIKKRRKEEEKKRKKEEKEKEKIRRQTIKMEEKKRKKEEKLKRKLEKQKKQNEIMKKIMENENKKKNQIMNSRKKPSSLVSKKNVQNVKPQSPLSLRDDENKNRFQSNTTNRNKNNSTDKRKNQKNKNKINKNSNNNKITTNKKKNTDIKKNTQKSNNNSSERDVFLASFSSLLKDVGKKR